MAAAAAQSPKPLTQAEIVAYAQQLSAPMQKFIDSANNTSQLVLNKWQQSDITEELDKKKANAAFYMNVMTLCSSLAEKIKQFQECKPENATDMGVWNRLHNEIKGDFNDLVERAKRVFDSQGLLLTGTKLQ